MAERYEVIVEKDNFLNERYEMKSGIQVGSSGNVSCAEP